MASIRRIAFSLLLGLFSASVALADTVDINIADAETLAQVLDGVGKSRAEAIVKYRSEFGPFQSGQDLVKVQGISDAIVAKNQDRIVVGKPQ